MAAFFFGFFGKYRGSSAGEPNATVCASGVFSLESGVLSSIAGTTWPGGSDECFVDYVEGFLETIREGRDASSGNATRNAALKN